MTSASWKGGGLAAPTGINVHDIASFSPVSLPGLALWLKADPAFCVTSTVGEYLATQTGVEQARLKAEFEGREEERVIIGIRSDAPGREGMMIPLLDTMREFPRLRERQTGPARIEFASTNSEPGTVRTVQLVSREPIQLPTPPAKFTSSSVSSGLRVEYISSLQRILLSPEPAAAGEGAAGLSELVIYSRELDPTELRKLEGYLAYRNATQDELPIGHPYAPDLMDEPVVASIRTALDTVETPVRTALTQLEDAVRRVEAVAPGAPPLRAVPAVKGSAQESLTDISKLRSTLSKGILLARRHRSNPGSGSITLEDVYAELNSRSLYPVPLSTRQIQAEIANVSEDYTAMTRLTGELQGYLASTLTQQSTQIVSGTYRAADAAFREEESEEHMQEMKVTLAIREFYHARRAHRKELFSAGDTLLEGHLASLRETLVRYLDAFIHSQSTIDKNYLDVAEPIQLLNSEFELKTWVAELKQTDTSVTEDLKRAGTHLRYTYRDPYLNSIEGAFVNLRECVIEGDLAYWKLRVDRATALVETMVAYAKQKRLTPWMAVSYTTYVKRLFEKVETWQAQFGALYEKVTQRLRIFKEILEQLRTTGTVPSTPLGGALLEGTAHQSDVRAQFLRPFHAMDRRLSGFEWVLTDASGAIGPDAPELVFPEWDRMDYDAAARVYSYTTPYRDASGAQLLQRFQCLDEFPLGKSALNSIPATYRPPVSLRTIREDEEVRLSPTQVDMLHVFIPEGATRPIQLPPFGLQQGQFYGILNSGSAPLVLRIPGSPADTYVSVSAQMGVLLLFQERSDGSETMKTFYGVRPMEPDQSAADPCTGLPRSRLCVYVPELKTSIYVVSSTVGPDATLRLRPLEDGEGAWIEARPDADGMVYDLDDSFHANPYPVKSMPETSLAQLLTTSPQARRVRLVQEVQAKVRIARESQTGLAVLVDAKGIPMWNEYGIVKTLRTPMYEIQGLAKVRGAAGDLECEVMTSTREPTSVLPFEPGARYNLLFRSTHIRPYQHGDIRGYVFVNESHFPLLTPRGKASLVPPDKLVEQVSGPFYTFVELGETRRLLLVEPETPLMTLNAEVYSIDATTNLVEAVNQRMDTYHTLDLLSLVLEYCAGLKTMLDAQRATLLEFNAEDTKSLREDLTEARDAVEKEEASVREYEPTVARLRAKSLEGPLPNEVKISVDVLELKLLEAARACAKEVRIVENAIRDTIQLLERAKRIQETYTSLQTVALETIPRVLQELQTQMKTEQTRRGVTSVPELEEVYQSVLTKRGEFETRSSEVKAALDTKPTYLSELPAWSNSTEKGLQALELQLRAIEQSRPRG